MTIACLVVCFNLPLLSTLSVCLLFWGHNGCPLLLSPKLSRNALRLFWTELSSMIYFSSLKNLCHRLANRKELSLSREKYILHNFGRHGHWHCEHVTFLVIYNFFKVGKTIRWAKYGNLTFPRVFSDKFISDIDFTDEAAVQSDVPVVKILY